MILQPCRIHRAAIHAVYRNLGIPLPCTWWRYLPGRRPRRTAIIADGQDHGWARARRAIGDARVLRVENVHVSKPVRRNRRLPLIAYRIAQAGLRRKNWRRRRTGFDRTLLSRSTSSL